jgi:hypothetical protein
MSNRHRWWLIVVLLLLLWLAASFVIGMIGDYLQTPEERAAAVEKAERAYAARKAEGEARASVNEELCRRARICRDYSSSRQRCAVAANFDACIQIKMGAEEARYIDG